MSPKAGGLVRSKTGRSSSPDVSIGDLRKVVAGNNAFAYDLYQAWRDGEGNLFFSPYSISLALAMTYGGARGETERQMGETLHFTLSQDSLHPALKALDLELARQASDARDLDGESFRLSIVSSIWGQKGYEFLPAFLDLLSENYGVGVCLADFAREPECSRVIINERVSDQTGSRVKELIPKGLIVPLTRLVLANAVYFKATWQHQFDTSRTQDGVFHLPTGEEVSVPMMSMSRSVRLPYSRGDGYQAVELPYVGGKVAMTVIVPHAGSFIDFETALDADQMGAIVAGLKRETVALRLPKFSYDSGFDMAGTLGEMGMPDAIKTGVADFSGMDGTLDLFIQDVFHKAFVAVDEAGTEAAAATAVVVALRGMARSAVQLTIDRPFIFLIRHVETGCTLFIGRVLNPEGE